MISQEHRPEAQSHELSRDNDAKPIAAEQRRALASRRRQLRCGRLKVRKQHLRGSLPSGSVRSATGQDSSLQPDAPCLSDSVDHQLELLRQENAQIQDRLAACTGLMATIQDHLQQYKAGWAGLLDRGSQATPPEALSYDLPAQKSITKWGPLGSMQAPSGLGEVLPENSFLGQSGPWQADRERLLDQLNMLQLENIHLKRRLSSCACLISSIDDHAQQSKADWAGPSGEDVHGPPLQPLPHDLCAQNSSTRRSSLESSNSCHDKPMEQHKWKDVELALWMAANRPARPTGWASAEGHNVEYPPAGSGSPLVFQAGAPSVERIGSQQQADQMPQFQGWDIHDESVGYDRLGPAVAGERPIQGQSVADLIPDAWAGNLDVLPDVPEGLESVDELATHISLWPQHPRM